MLVDDFLKLDSLGLDSSNVPVRESELFEKSTLDSCHPLVFFLTFRLPFSDLPQLCKIPFSTLYAAFNRAIDLQVTIDDVILFISLCQTRLLLCLSWLQSIDSISNYSLTQNASDLREKYPQMRQNVKAQYFIDAVIVAVNPTAAPILK